MIKLFHTERVWQEIKEMVWSLAEGPHSSGQIQDSELTWMLEQRLATQYGRSHCVTTASCTDALIISLWCLGLPPGSRVAVSAYTYIATAHAIARAGYVPVPIDVYDDYTINVGLIENCAAVVAVDVFGNMSNWGWLDKFDIPVICDAAQSLESHNGDCYSVQYGVTACTSFSPSKPVTCWGSGGAIFTDDFDIFQAARRLRIHGRPVNSDQYLHTGMNSMMSSFEAACVMACLEYHQAWLRRRQAISLHLISESVHPSNVGKTQYPSFSKLVFLAEQREQVRKQLTDLGIESAMHYLPVNQQIIYQADCYNATLLGEMSFTVPNHHALTDAEVEIIAKGLK